MSKGRELFSRAISSPRFLDGGEWRYSAMAAEEENGKKCYYIKSITGYPHFRTKRIATTTAAKVSSR